MIRLTVNFLDMKKFSNLIRYIQDCRLPYEDIVNISDKAVDNARETIKTSKKRHSLGDNLERNIDKEVLKLSENDVEIGIGNVNKLKTNAPYYEVLNDGGYVPYSTRKGAPLGSFEGDRPDSAVVSGNQNWERSGEKGYFMKPKKPIEGIGYIQKMIKFIDNQIRTFIVKFPKEYITGIK